MAAVHVSPWCDTSASQQRFHHLRYQPISATQVVDTLGVVGVRPLPSRPRRWRPSTETRRGTSTYGSKKKPEMTASWTNSTSWPPAESSHGMPLGVRLSGHTRFYNSDSLPKGLSWMRGYRIEPRRQRCSDDRADSSVTSVQGHCLRSRGLPHNAKRASVRPKKPMCSSCSGGVVYHLVCEFRSRRRSRNNDDDEESKEVVDDVGMPVTQNEYANSVDVTSESDSEEGVDDDGGTTGDHGQDQKEDSPRDDADSNETSSVDSRSNENAMEGTYTIETRHVTKSSAVQEASTVTQTKSDGHQNASGESSDADSINEDINVGDSDSDARNTIEFVKSNK